MYYKVFIILASICDLHFDPECFEKQWTKPRLSNIPKKEMARMKKGSIPTQMLQLHKKRKITSDETDSTTKESTNQHKKVKVYVHVKYKKYINNCMCTCACVYFLHYIYCRIPRACTYTHIHT